MKQMRKDSIAVVMVPIFLNIRDAMISCISLVNRNKKINQ